ncbi:MAG TPA: hypothetical protein PKI62_11645 [bacterium]|nr:hypothetical protein [bacterium]HPR88045.1 hypothetical protein [bacterium]
MDETIYLGDDPKRSMKWPIISFLLAFFAIALQTAASLIQHRPWAPIYAVLLLASLLSGIYVLMHTRRNGLPRLVIQESSLHLKPGLWAKLRSIAAAEIDHFAIHPSRVDLFLKTESHQAIPLSCYNFAENKRLKSVLKAFAEQHRIPCTETASSSATSRLSAPH